MRAVAKRPGRLLPGLLVLVAGCAATPQTLNRSALRASNPRTLIAVRSPTPSFRAITSGDALLAALFTPPLIALAIAAGGVGGSVIARSDALEDPAVVISRRLAEALSRKYALRVLGSVIQAASPGDRAVQYRSADLVLEVRTSHWGFQPTAMGRYGATYDGTLTLIDMRTDTVLVEGVCSFHPVDTSDAPTRDDLLAGKGTVLKQMIQSIAEFCSDDYRTRILGLYQ
jgi:hypothetical protein